MSIRIALAQINTTVGDFVGNTKKILAFAKRSAEEGANIVVTPELSLSGYSPEDWLLRKSFYQKNQTALVELREQLKQWPELYVLVGHPDLENGHYFNAASVFKGGQLIVRYCKHSLPNNAVFDEKRYFSSATQAAIFKLGGIAFGVNICEDIWSEAAPKLARQAGAEILLTLNASPYHIKKPLLREQLMRDTVIKQGMALVYVNLIGGQDELVFDGNSFVMNQAGEVCLQLKHAEEDLQFIDIEEGQIKPSAKRNSQHSSPQFELAAQIYQLLVLGLRDYIQKNRFEKVLLGLSGGVDSALTLAIAVDALGADKVHAVMLSSPYTSEISKIDARELSQNLGVQYHELPIDACFEITKKTLALDSLYQNSVDHAPTEENIQARIRATLLMALSNRWGALLLNTSNKSEIAVGYGTLYGDMAGAFAVIKDIAKTEVYRLCDYRNQLAAVIPQRILTRAPSAELKPNQTDQDSLPAYKILDSILQQYVEELRSPEEIIASGHTEQDVKKVLHLIRISEYKRRQAPIGTRVTQRGFGRDWRYPLTSQFEE